MRLNIFLKMRIGKLTVDKGQLIMERDVGNFQLLIVN